MHNDNLPIDQHRPNPQPIPTGIQATEPALSTGSITAAVTAVLALLVAYGFDISQEQQVAILGVITIVAPLVVAIITRGQVYSPATTARIANEAAVTGDATIDPPPANGKK